GKWVCYTKLGRDLLPHVFILPSDGGTEKRTTDHDSYSDSSALWTPDGKSLVYLSGSDTGNIGQTGRSTAQIQLLSLTHQDKEPGATDIDSEEDAARAERDQRPRRGRSETAEGSSDQSPTKLKVKIDLDRIVRRSRQLTRTGDSIGGMVVS